MNIRIEYDTTGLPDTGRESFRTPPAPAWAEIEENGMVFALRFHPHDGVPVLSEIRIFPTEPDEGRAAGLWSDTVDSVPVGGLDTTAIHNTALGKLRDAALAIMGDPSHESWGTTDLDRYENWFDAVGVSGIDPEVTRPKPRGGGAPPKPDEHWAEVAYHYVEALKMGVDVHAHIRSQMQEGGERLPTENWASEARKRGWLTPPPKQGKAGGSLTPKAIKKLIEMGFIEGPKEKGEH